ncbi:MAG: DUF402 domain-containing protein [Clostridia bacterium]|nr:DUF402 domain-containing protein [Clostridia bacterium]
MSERDMERSGWTRVLSKKQIIKDFSCGEKNGKISLLKILEIREPLKKKCGESEIVLADTGYYWLQLALDRSHAWFSVAFDAQTNLIEIYVDVTDGNDAAKDNPTFEDMYLDYVVSSDGVLELDRDELDEAYSSGIISKKQYETALAEGKKIRRYLTDNAERIQEFFRDRFEELKTELESKNG